MALVLPLLENLGKDKHVESLWFPRLDEGSIPSSSTFRLIISRFFKKQGVVEVILLQHPVYFIWVKSNFKLNSADKDLYLSR